MTRNSWLLPAVVSLAGLIAGCGKQGGQMAGGFPAMQVVAVEAKRQPVSETLPLVGTVAADEQVDLRSEIDGTVQGIKFEEGKPVEKGQLLIQLDPTKLAASVAESEAAFKLTEENFERMKTLQKGNVMAQQEYDQTASAYEIAKATLDRRRRELRDTQIVAPFAGVMGSRTISPGQVINKDAKLASVVALDPVKVEVNVPERFLGEVQTGQKIDVKVAAYPKETFKGEVFFVAPQVDTTTRTVMVKARIANGDFRLKPGMFARLDLTLKIKDDAVVIPEAAVILNGDAVCVFIVDSQTNAQIRMVKTGVRMAGQVEITDGLKGGELVIVEGYQKTPPGAKVTLAPAESAKPYAAGGNSTH
jgi:membrane fusion protein, multidrug efflux system